MHLTQAPAQFSLFGEDDVVFSLNRATDKDSVPDHRTYSLHESMKNVEIVTDPAEEAKVSGGEGTVLEALGEGLEAGITELVRNKTAEDNGAGKYQVVKVTTKEPFPKRCRQCVILIAHWEIHLFNGVPETKYELVENDDKLVLQKNDSNAVTYLLFNAFDREVAKSENLRKAVLYSINQDEFLNYYQGNKKRAYSTVSPLVDTGNELVADSAKVKEFLAGYEAE